MKAPSTSLAWSGPTRAAMVAVFLAIIALPVLDTLLHLSPKNLLREKREGAPYPPRGLLDPPAFETAYNDRFGFRDALIYGHNWIDTFFFRVSPTKRAVMGNGGWLYLNESLDDYRGVSKLSPRTMEQWRVDMAAKAAFFAERGITYLLVIAPNKESTYPEFLPVRFQKVERMNSFDKLERYLEGRAPCEFLDLRPPFLAEKRAHATKLFLKTDTHWNQSGAVLATQEIMARLHRRLPDLPLPADDDYRRVPKDLPGGDLAEMIGFPQSFGEQDTSLIPRNSRPQVVANPSWAANSKLPIKALESELPGRDRRVLLCGDSFGLAITPLLASQFKRLVYIRQSFMKRSASNENNPAIAAEIIEAEHPDIVIELFTERYALSAPRSTLSPKR